jgi:YHS domain-containing protein
VIRVLLIAVLLFLIARSFWRVIDGILEATTGTPSRGRRQPPRPSVRLVRDPVCGTHVPVNAALSLTDKGQTYYFCSERCRDDFQRRA